MANNNRQKKCSAKVDSTKVLSPLQGLEYFHVQSPWANNAMNIWAFFVLIRMQFAQMAIANALPQ
jgi:hypothetical protein